MAEKAEALHNWPFWARDEQLPPLGEWRTWLIMAGRGFGKTRTVCEWARDRIENYGCGRLAIVAETAADARDVLIEGESGLLSICPPWNRPNYEPSKRRVTWPNGAIASTYSADDPEQLRGPQHDAAIADEIGKWRYFEAWDNLQFGLRLGSDPRCAVATTPRPTKLLRDLMAQKSTVVTRGTTYENAVNLAPAFMEQIISRYEGTRIGRQELNAELLEDVPGALWTREMIEQSRAVNVPPLVRVVVGVDPEAESGDQSAETGIIVAGIDVHGHGWILEDASAHGTPHVWGKAVVAAHSKHKADRIIGEVNNGGEMIEFVIKTVARDAGIANVPYKAIRASRGKQARAEPIAALYEQRKVHHVGLFAQLEDQMAGWVPGQGMASPDRLDALVWALSELMLTGGGKGYSSKPM